MSDCTLQDYIESTETHEESEESAAGRITFSNGSIIVGNDVSVSVGDAIEDARGTITMQMESLTVTSDTNTSIDTSSIEFR